MEGVEDAAVDKETERQSLLMLGAGEQQGAGSQDSEPGVSVKGPAWAALLGGQLSRVYLQKQGSRDKKVPVLPTLQCGQPFALLWPLRLASSLRKRSQNVFCFPSPLAED